MTPSSYGCAAPDDDFGFTSLYISLMMSDGNSSLIIIYIYNYIHKRSETILSTSRPQLTKASMYKRH